MAEARELVSVRPPASTRRTAWRSMSWRRSSITASTRVGAPALEVSRSEPVSRPLLRNEAVGRPRAAAADRLGVSVSVRGPHPRLNASTWPRSSRSGRRRSSATRPARGPASCRRCRQRLVHLAGYPSARGRPREGPSCMRARAPPALPMLPTAPRRTRTPARRGRERARAPWAKSSWRSASVPRNAHSTSSMVPNRSWQNGVARYELPDEGLCDHSISGDGRGCSVRWRMRPRRCPCRQKP